MLLWIGISFPDGLTVIHDPATGANTDITQWRDCPLQDDLEDEMQERVQNGQTRLKLYADKIFNSSALVTAAFSRKHHNVLNGDMLRLNLIMSKVRVGVEWSFGAIMEKWKLLGYGRGQLLQRSPLKKQFHVAVLLENSFICLNGCIHTAYFGVEPPTIHDFYNQQ